MSAMKTFSPRPRDIERRWYVVDADGAVLGRLASEVAKILRGKHKPIFAPHADTGDHVIVINARRVRVTGGKENEKNYYHHSGYPGGLRTIGYADLLEKRPVLAVEKAIKGMLPKNRLGRQMATKLQVYEGAEHPHAAQQPRPLGLGEVPAWEGLPAPKPPKPVRERPAKAAKAKEPARAKTPARGSAKPAAGRRSTAAGSSKGSPAATTRRSRATEPAPAPEPEPAGAEAAPDKPSRRRRRGPKQGTEES